MEIIKAEFSESSVNEALAKLPRAEEIIKQVHGTTRLWESTRIKILLAILGTLILPGRMATYEALLQRTSFQESEIYNVRKVLILEGVAPNQFVDRKRELFRQAVQQITNSELETSLKSQAVRILTQLASEYWLPTTKSPKVFAAIVLKAAAELKAYEITTQRICEAVGSSYLPQQKVSEVLELITPS